MKVKAISVVRARMAAWLRGRSRANVVCANCARDFGGAWPRLYRRQCGVRMRGTLYCGAECLEIALLEVLGRSGPSPQSVTLASRRVPLGLILLSRQQLTESQLRTALESQRMARGSLSSSENRVESLDSGRKKIGEWLQDLGFVTEQQVTAALARQWSCPILRNASMAIAASRVPAIPRALLESFQMIPVELVEATGTLLIAFSEGIDYTVLYAIEQMLGYHTEACLVSPSTLRMSLGARLPGRGSSDVSFDRLKDTGECVRIVGNYALKVKAVEVRVARCGEHFWIRLERLQQEAVTLVLRAPGNASQFPLLSAH